MNDPSYNLRSVFIALAILANTTTLHAAPLSPDPAASALRVQAAGMEDKYDYTDAIPLYQKAYIIDHADGTDDSALDLYSAGNCCVHLSLYQKALDFFQQALTIVTQTSNTKAQASVLNSIGSAYDGFGKYTDGLGYFQHALPLEKQIGDQILLSRTLNNIGYDYDKLSQYPKALDFLQESLTIQLQLKDGGGIGSEMNGIGVIYDTLGDYAKAMDLYKQALPLRQKAGDLPGYAVTLSNLGQSYSETGQYEEAESYFQQALPIEKKVGDKQAEAGTLSNLGMVYDNMSQYVKALDYYQQALQLGNAIGDTGLQSIFQTNIGAIYQKQGDVAKALDFFQQSLHTAQQIGDQDSEATTLNNIGMADNGYARYADAISLFQQALPIEEKIGDVPNQAIALNNIGLAYEGLSQYGDSLKYLQQALPIEQKIGNKVGEAVSLSNIGQIYVDLNQLDDAQDYLQQALAIDQQMGHKSGEANVLNNLGEVYIKLDLPDKAQTVLQQALAIEQGIGKDDDAASTLDNIGLTYNNQGQYTQALDAYQKALAITRQAGNKSDEGLTLNNVGWAYIGLKKYPQALDFFEQSLTAEQQTSNEAREAGALSNMMSALDNLGDAKAAIFYGKLAVNLIQNIRKNITSLDKETQKTYIAGNAFPYRYLADLLISQGRLTEAQQVLRLLKENEFFDFLNPDPVAPAPPLDNIAFTAREAHWSTAYNAAAQPMIDLGAKAQALSVVQERTPAEDAQLASLQSRITQAAAALASVRKQINTDFSGPATTDDALPETTGADDIQHALRPDEAALYTIVSPDRLDLILITSKGQKAYSSPITADALYKDVLTLRQALMAPNLDPRPSAAVLYHLLLDPVKKDLDAIGAKTILFSLDDALRYVPPAVLYDPSTSQYVVQRYQTELITLASSAPTTRSSEALSVLGLGVTKSLDGEPALPGVARELAAIIREPQDDDNHGLLPGRRLLDAQFTESALKNGLKTGHYPIVHLASHFALHGTLDTSYLLLGDGTHLSVADLAADPNRFQGVDLLTLSACQTAMEVRGSSGHEVEGVGALAQKLGAGSVLASLWPVSDAATPLLMTSLYKYHEQHPTAPLAEALQAAQLSLLNDPRPQSADAADRGVIAVARPGEQSSIPAFTPNPKAPYAHPFYWAPFILIGNWR